MELLIIFDDVFRLNKMFYENINFKKSKPKKQTVKIEKE